MAHIHIKVLDHCLIVNIQIYSRSSHYASQRVFNLNRQSVSTIGIAIDRIGPKISNFRIGSFSTSIYGLYPPKIGSIKIQTIYASRRRNRQFWNGLNSKKFPIWRLQFHIQLRFEVQSNLDLLFCSVLVPD